MRKYSSFELWEPMRLENCESLLSVTAASRRRMASVKLGSADP